MGAKATLTNGSTFWSFVPFRDGFLIVGGYSYGQRDYLDNIQYYNPSTDQWEMMPQTMDFKNDHLAAFLVPDSYAYCF